MGLDEVLFYAVGVISWLVIAAVLFKLNRWKRAVEKREREEELQKLRLRMARRDADAQDYIDFLKARS